MLMSCAPCNVSFDTTIASISVMVAAPVGSYTIASYTEKCLRGMSCYAPAGTSYVDKLMGIWGVVA